MKIPQKSERHVMTQVLKAVFDGKVFRPKEPVNLEPNSELQIIVEIPDGKKLVKQKSLLAGVAEMNLSGPADWSEHFEDYLDGTKQLPE